MRTRPRPPAADRTPTPGAVSLVPATVEVQPRTLRVGDAYTATYIVTGYPDTVAMAWLEPLLSWPGRLDLTLHVDPVPPDVAAAQLRKQRARLESSRRADADRGRLDDPAVDAAAADAADLADSVARGATRLFTTGVYLTVHARSHDELADACTQLRTAAAGLLLDLQPATWRHLHGWKTTLPLGVDELRATRTLDTAALAAALPIASPDLPTPLPGRPASGGVLYGTNLATGGIVWWDRWAQDNHNSVLIARSGAGKSYLAKLDLLRNLYQGVHAAAVDPEDEYSSLAHQVGGTVVQLGAPGVRLNPLDLPTGDTRPDTLTRRALFLHTLVAVLIGTALDPLERVALDDAILAAYTAAGITADPGTWTRPAPLLADLTTHLTGHAGRQLAARLAPYVTGSFRDLFAGPTTSRPDGHLVVWSLRHLPDELRTIGTLLALDSIWRAVDHPLVRRRRLVVVDEAWLLLRDGTAAQWLFTMAKAARKRDAGLAVITQDIADVLATDLGTAVVSNASTQLLMRQAPQVADQVADAFALTDPERAFITTARRAEALLIGDAGRVAFDVLASPTEHQLIQPPQP